MLVDRSVRDLIAAFASPDPAPGGGSASALASAVGASLLQMVASLPKTRTGSGEERAALTGAAAALGDLLEQLMTAIDADSAAYDRVVAAYRLPKASPDEQRARTAAIQTALRGATDVPMDVMRLSARALALAETIAAHGLGTAASDAGVAIALLRAGLHGAGLNVDVNLGSVSDVTYADGARSERGRLTTDAMASAERAESLLRRG